MTKRIEPTIKIDQVELRRDWVNYIRIHAAPEDNQGRTITVYTETGKQESYEQVNIPANFEQITHLHRLVPEGEGGDTLNINLNKMTDISPSTSVPGKTVIGFENGAQLVCGINPSQRKHLSAQWEKALIGLQSSRQRY